LITLIILLEEYKLWSFSLCSFLQPPVTSSLFGPNILNTLLQNKLRTIIIQAAVSCGGVADSTHEMYSEATHFESQIRLRLLSVLSLPTGNFVK
jgi:hypothetical protein